MESPSLYSHFPFSATPKHPEIRILTLAEGAFTDEIVIKLCVVALSRDNPPQYEALSYVWGSPDDPSQVTVVANGNTYPPSVTRNLDVALRHLRYTDRERAVWVDAICIDQSNLNERSSQVANMTMVYELAAQVVVWLGPEADDSSLAVETLRDLGSKVVVDWLQKNMAPADGLRDEDLHWSDALVELPYQERELRAVRRLLKRPWFERLWVLQEVRRATSEVTVVSGYSTMLWSRFLDALYCLLVKDIDKGIERRENEAKNYDLFPLLNMHNPRENSLIPHLLHRASHWKCKDDRDRVYAVVPLSGRSLGEVGITPDYAAPVWDVYRDLVLRYIEFSGKLDIITILPHNGKASSSTSNPSWIPSFNKGAGSAFMRLQMASGDLAADWAFLGNSSLKVAGVYCGTVDEVNAFSMPTNRLSGIKSEVQRIAPRNIGHGTYLTGCSMMEAFASTLGCTTEVEHDPPSQTAWTAREMESWLTVLLGSEKDESWDVRIYAGHVYNNSLTRNFVTTREGCIGLAPKATQPGDVLCVLLGLECPIVLRKAGHGKYSVVGACFAYGLGLGEAVYGAMPVGYTPIARYKEGAGRYEWLYRNDETGEVTSTHPSLAAVRSQQVKFESEASEINLRRVEREELAKLGVRVEDFELV